jgi:hypothetical protein
MESWEGHEGIIIIIINFMTEKQAASMLTVP